MALERPLRILIVEDDEFDARKLMTSLRVVFGEKGTIYHARTAVEMVRAASREPRPDTVVLDDRLPDGASGEQSLKDLRATGFSGRVVLLSGLFTAQRRQALARLGAVGVLDKDDADSLTLAELLLGSPEQDGGT